MNCELCQRLMADGVYDGLDHSVSRSWQAHLAACADCRACHEELKAAKRLLDQAGDTSDVSEPRPVESLWRKIQPALDGIDEQREQRRGLQPATWGLALSAAAGLVVFVLATVPRLEQPAPLTDVSASVVQPGLMNYLDRAQVMFMQVANAESTPGSLLPVNDELARSMAFEANLLRVADNGGVTSGQRKLLQDCEFLLLQIANLDDSNRTQGMALLQDHLEENDVLFRIRLLEMRDRIDGTD